MKQTAAKKAKPPEPTTELALLPTPETVLTVFTTPNGLDPHLAVVRAEIDAFVPDVSTKKGRDAIASIAYSVARSSTALDDVGKELVTKYKEIPKQIDAERKRMRDTLAAWKEEVRWPLTDWEQKEEQRVEDHQAGIYSLEALGNALEGLSVVQLKNRLKTLKSVKVGKAYEEFEIDALRAQERAADRLAVAIHERQVYEDEQAELARLREEAEKHKALERQRLLTESLARDAKIRAEREVAERTRAAEARINALEKEKDDALRREQKAKQDAETVALRERDKVLREQNEERERAAARESSARHCRGVEARIIKALVTAGMQLGQAQLAVKLVASGDIANISIQY